MRSIAARSAYFIEKVPFFQIEPRAGQVVSDIERFTNRGVRSKSHYRAYYGGVIVIPLPQHRCLLGKR